MKNMDKQVLESIENQIKSKYFNDSGGHDWCHIIRVRNLAVFIAEQENADIFYSELLAILHETTDYKLVEDVKNNLQEILQLCEDCDIEKPIINRLVKEIPQISYQGAGVVDNEASLECNIVRDADRLDAMGAIGIARTFAYGGKHSRIMYNPEIQPKLHQSFEDYKNSQNTTINHFFEKLLLLKDRMHTDTACKIAQKRHLIMKTFLKDFKNEWNMDDVKH
jgi:uncharacterized protein